MMKRLFVLCVLMALMAPFALAANAEAPSNLTTKPELVYLWVAEDGVLTVLANTPGIGTMIDFGVLTTTPIGDEHCKAYLDDAGVATVEMAIPAGQASVFADGTLTYLAGPKGWPASAMSDCSKMPSATVTNQRVAYKVPDFTAKIKVGGFTIKS